MSGYTIDDLKLIKRIIDLAEFDLREDLDAEEEQYRRSNEDERGLSSISSSYLSQLFSDVQKLKKLTEKLIEEENK
jgi:hypothetical protein